MSEVWKRPDQPIFFPLKAQYERRHHTLERVQPTGFDTEALHKEAERLAEERGPPANAGEDSDASDAGGIHGDGAPQDKDIEANESSSTGKYDEVGGRKIRRRTGTSRPPWCWPEVWQSYWYGKRKKISEEWQAECDVNGTDWWGDPLKDPEAIQAAKDRIAKADKAKAEPKKKNKSAKGSGASSSKDHDKPPPPPPAAAAAQCLLSREMRLTEQLSRNKAKRLERAVLLARENEDQPFMPVLPKDAPAQEHRPVNTGDGPFSLMPPAFIARRLTKADIKASKEAQDAITAERRKLESIPCWDMDHPVSWPEVAAQARKQGKKAYIGDVLPLVYEKHAELDKGDKKDAK